MTHPINGLDDLLYIMFGAKPASRTANGLEQATREQLFPSSASSIWHVAMQIQTPL